MKVQAGGHPENDRPWSIETDGIEAVPGSAEPTTGHQAVSVRCPADQVGLRIAPRRLVVTGTILVDILLYLDELPAPGGAVNASRTVVTAGAGYNVLAGAVRLGLPAAYAGLVGDGPFGVVVRQALAGIGVPVLVAARTGEDTGFDVGLVETGSGRQPTFIGAPGVESRLSPADLRGLALTPGDAIYVSGYDLSYPAAGAALADWVTSVGPECLLVFDPGPLAGRVDAARLDAVVGRADLLSLNLAEAATLAGRPGPAKAASGGQDPAAPGSGHDPAGPGSGHDPEAAGSGHDPAALAADLSRRVRAQGWIVLRTGPDGCWIARAESPPQHIPPRPTTPADPTGAGDTHIAVMLARLAVGQDIAEAARWANVAASLAVEQAGPSTSPSADELARAMAGRH
jgi:sugar/nucleoside kinase (ribokinase family)